MESVRIVGAGLSGMTAAVLLAREGYKVVVMDDQKGIGGSPSVHPSVHTTPAQLPELWDYVGLNLQKDFNRCNPYPRFYYNKKLMKLPPYAKYNVAFCVERGSRPTSIDSRLFEMARELGVTFEFETRIDLANLKAGTIVATGLYPEGYEQLGIPYRRIYVSWSHREITDQTATGSIYMGPFVTPDYAYTAQVNGLDFALIFSHHPIAGRNRESYKEVLESVGKGVYPEPWRDVAMAVPAEARLISGKVILAGTLSGMIEPFWGYGIVGAIISGRVAAQAIMNRDKAEKDFTAFTGGFAKKFQRRERFTSYSPSVSGLLIKAGIIWARLQCLWDRDRASKPREPVKWFR
jgi:flavin-dependent dehydrogenase